MSLQRSTLILWGASAVASSVAVWHFSRKTSLTVTPAICIFTRKVLNDLAIAWCVLFNDTEISNCVSQNNAKMLLEQLLLATPMEQKIIVKRYLYQNNVPPLHQTYFPLN